MKKTMLFLTVAFLATSVNAESFFNTGKPLIDRSNTTNVEIVEKEPAVKDSASFNESRWNLDIYLPHIIFLAWEADRQVTQNVMEGAVGATYKFAEHLQATAVIYDFDVKGALETDKYHHRHYLGGLGMRFNVNNNDNRVVVNVLAGRAEITNEDTGEKYDDFQTSFAFQLKYLWAGDNLSHGICFAYIDAPTKSTDEWMNGGFAAISYTVQFGLPDFN